ncbi:MAG: hypothetical protein JSW11_01160 [Candidatus Heimdallarchaeota archaeon]|nr:MAG: hypothetical protein JSW11_01160 [Candidatus Heimdallarchaeota archaeon]
MPIILRIDVDNPYGYYSFPKKVLNYFSTNYRRFPIRYDFLGYLAQAKSLFHTLREAKIPATWFFRVQSRPNRKFQQELLSSGHEIAYHAERTASLRYFQDDLQELSKNLPTPILGYSKHGSGQLKLSKYHTVEYDFPSLIKLGQEMNLRYFTGNEEIPTLEPLQMGELQVFKGSFWLDENYRDVVRYPITWLIEAASKGKTIVLLTHPYKWVYSRKEKEDFQTLVEAIDDFQTFSSIIS